MVSVLKNINIFYSIDRSFKLQYCDNISGDIFHNVVRHLQ